jgi:hypothetical protein
MSNRAGMKGEEDALWMQQLDRAVTFIETSRLDIPAGMSEKLKQDRETVLMDVFGNLNPFMDEDAVRAPGDSPCVNLVSPSLQRNQPAIIARNEADRTRAANLAARVAKPSSAPPPSSAPSACASVTTAAGSPVGSGKGMLGKGPPIHPKAASFKGADMGQFNEENKGRGSKGFPTVSLPGKPAIKGQTGKGPSVPVVTVPDAGLGVRGPSAPISFAARPKGSQFLVPHPDAQGTPDTVRHTGAYVYYADPAEPTMYPPNIGEPGLSRAPLDLDDPDTKALAEAHPYSDIGKQYWDAFSQRTIESVDAAVDPRAKRRWSSPQAPPNRGAGSYGVSRPPIEPVVQSPRLVSRPKVSHASGSRGPSDSEERQTGDFPSSTAASSGGPGWVPTMRPPAPISRPPHATAAPQLRPSAPAHGKGPYAPSRASATAEGGKGTPKYGKGQQKGYRTYRWGSWDGKVGW